MVTQEKQDIFSCTSTFLERAQIAKVPIVTCFNPWRKKIVEASTMQIVSEVQH